MTFESGKRALFQYSSQTQRKTTCQYIKWKVIDV